MGLIVIFALGMLAMLNLSLIAVCVVGLVKVVKNNKKLNENLKLLEKTVEDNQRDYLKDISDITRDIYNIIEEYNKNQQLADKELHDYINILHDDSMKVDEDNLSQLIKHTEEVYDSLRKSDDELYSYVDKRIDKVLDKIEK
jgi:mevalonate kinase